MSNIIEYILQYPISLLSVVSDQLLSLVKIDRLP